MLGLFRESAVFFLSPVFLRFLFKELLLAASFCFILFFSFASFGMWNVFLGYLSSLSFIRRLSSWIIFFVKSILFSFGFMGFWCECEVSFLFVLNLPKLLGCIWFATGVRIGIKMDWNGNQNGYIPHWIWFMTRIGIWIWNELWILGKSMDWILEDWGIFPFLPGMGLQLPSNQTAAIRVIHSHSHSKAQLSPTKDALTRFWATPLCQLGGFTST